MIMYLLNLKYISLYPTKHPNTTLYIKFEFFLSQLLTASLSIRLQYIFYFYGPSLAKNAFWTHRYDDIEWYWWISDYVYKHYIFNEWLWSWTLVFALFWSPFCWSVGQVSCVEAIVWGVQNGWNPHDEADKFKQLYYNISTIFLKWM